MTFRTILRWLEWVSVPATAGLACTVLSLGVVTWLPALAATAQVLHRWRTEGDQRAFVGVFEAFGNQWKQLWKHALVSTAVGAVLLVNITFLLARPGAFPLLALQVGLALTFLTYHLALAATVGRTPSAPRQTAIRLAFGGRGFLLLAATGAAVVASAPLGIGPLMFGPTIPLLLALAFLDRSAPTPER